MGTFTDRQGSVPARSGVVGRAAAWLLAVGFVVQSDAPRLVAVIGVSVFAAAFVIVRRMAVESRARHWTWTGIWTAGTALLVLGSPGPPERWAVVPMAVSLIGSRADDDRMRRGLPIALALSYVLASLVSGRGSLVGTTGTATLIVAGSAYASSQGRSLAAQVTTTADVRGRLERVRRVLASQADLVTLDSDRTIRAATEALLLVGYDMAVVAEIRNEMVERIHARGVAEGELPPTHVSEGIVGLAIKENRVVVIDDYRASALAMPLDTPSIGSSIVAPLRIGGEVKGVLIAAGHDVSATAVHEVQVVEALAAQVSRALANAHRYRGQLALVSRLEELDHLKADFLLSVSADLRGPLSNVRGLAHTLSVRLDDLDEAARTLLLERLLVNAERLNGLVVGLLDFSKLRMGHGGLEMSGVDLTALATSVVDELEGSGLVSLVVSGSGIVDGDEILLRRAVRELVHNALHHTPDDTHVEVEVATQDEHVTIEVRDRGEGLSDEVVAVLRGESRPGVLGLGLTTVVQTLAVHGARLVVRDRPGTGIGFTLPRQSESLRPTPVAS